MTTPTTPNQPDPTPNHAFVEATFDYMRNAIERRDGDGLVTALHALRSELGDDQVNAMLDYLLKVGTQRVIQRMADDATQRSFTTQGHGVPPTTGGRR